MKLDPKQIEFFAENMAKELMDMPSFNIQEIKQKLQVRFGFMLRDVLKGQLNYLEIYRTELVKEYNHSTTHSITKRKLNAEISELNLKIKEFNKSVDNVKDYNEYQLLKDFCKEKMPADFLEEYYSIQKTVR